MEYNRQYASQITDYARRNRCAFLFFCLPVLFGTLFVACTTKQNGTIIINEVLAKNNNGWRDEDGDTSDWVELYNPTHRKVSLEGYTLTDRPTDSKRWTFSAITIAPKEYLLIWASGKDRRGKGALHTNFKLNGDGESLYLIHPNGQIVDALTFDAQRTNVSYGRRFTQPMECCYFTTPSPGKPNPAGGYLGVAEPPICTLAEGFYSESATVGFETSTEGAEIRYTLDASTPTMDYSTKYSSPLTLKRTTVVRACAFKKDYLPSTPITKTYLIGVKHALPVLSIATEPEYLWDRRNGIYTNSNRSGKAWERPVSATLFQPDGTPQVTFAAGLRIHGGASRQRSDKQSFRLYFRKKYGESVLDAPIFPSAPAISHIDRLVLRGGYNDSWCHGTAAKWNIATYVRDQLVRDLHLDMGAVAAHGDFVALYLNGEYWGLYNICERISGEFLSRYLGEGDWDIIKDDRAREGDSIAWEQFKAWYESVDLALEENYRIIGGMMDIENFTDYFILNTWVHNYDWPHHNWYTARRRGDTNARWMFLIWDAEYAFGGGREPFQSDRNTLARASTPHGSLGLLFNKMLQNAEYRAYFTARFEERLKGVLSPDHVLKRLAERLDQVRPEIKAEARRWHSSKSMADWEEAVDSVKAFVDQRTKYVRRHLQSIPDWLRYQSYPKWYPRYPRR